jgi:hypothetical protein
MADPNNSRKSGREGCEAPEAPLPLHPPVSCDLLHLKWEAINKESNFVSLFSAHYIPSCKSLSSHPRALQAQCMVIFPNSLHFTTSLKPSIGPTQPAKPVLNIHLSTLICLPNILCHVRKPRDSPRHYLEPGILMQ